MSLALATQPRVLLLDEPLAGLAAAERERVGNLIKSISKDLPVLLVEHDIDRVFQIADHVTVMNEGKVLVDGDAEHARTSSTVQEVYIGSGTTRSRPSRAPARRRRRSCSASTRSTPSMARATSSGMFRSRGQAERDRRPARPQRRAASRRC